MFLPQMFFVVSPRVLPDPSTVALKLDRTIGNWLNFIIQVQKFEGAPHKKLGAKHEKFLSILDNFRV